MTSAFIYAGIDVVQCDSYMWIVFDVWVKRCCSQIGSVIGINCLDYWSWAIFEYFAGGYGCTAAHDWQWSERTRGTYGQYLTYNLYKRNFCWQIWVSRTDAPIYGHVLFLVLNFFCKVVIRLQEQYLYSFCFCAFLPLPSLAALCHLSLFQCLSTFKP